MGLVHMDIDLSKPLNYYSRAIRLQDLEHVRHQGAALRRMGHVLHNLWRQK
jgi:hypothetical protein